MSQRCSVRHDQVVKRLPSLTRPGPRILDASDPPVATTVRSDAAGMPDGRHERTCAVVRIAFGLVWLVDASLKWTPHFINGYLGHLAEGSDGRPGWLQPWFRLWRNVQAPAPRAFAYFVAVTETLIALALVSGIARKLTYLSATFFSLMIWSTAEGFGGPYTGRGADVDVGAGLIYALVFVSLLHLTADGPDRYSLDSIIERHLPWWHRLAELDSGRKPAILQREVRSGPQPDR